MPPGRSPNASAMKVAVEPPETPFTTKKEIRRGKSQKYAKGFLGWAQRGLARARRRGLVHTFFWK